MSRDSGWKLVVEHLGFAVKRLRENNNYSNTAVDSLSFQCKSERQSNGIDAATTAASAAAAAAIAVLGATAAWQSGSVRR